MFNQVGAGGRRDRLLSIEKRWWDGARGGAKSARVPESDGATSHAAWLPLVSGFKHRRLHTSWREWCARQIFRHRETMLELCRWPRTVCESVGERDGVTAQAMCRPWVFPVKPMHAHILRGRWTRQILPPKNGVGTVAEAARVFESDDATAQVVCRPWVCSCVCDVCLGVSCIVVGVGREGGYCRMSSKCDRDMRGSTVGMLSIRETPWSA
jgi:hypothetical protein